MLCLLFYVALIIFMASLTSEQVDQFSHNGFLHVHSLFSQEQCDAITSLVLSSLDPVMGPIEPEVDYPQIPRRLLHVLSRDSSYRKLASSTVLVRCLQQLFDDENLLLTQAHHNCVMTKYPKYGASTGWHQDQRYWAFEQTHLINVWIALGDECSENGALHVIPKSHTYAYGAQAFDEALYFREDIEDNQQWLSQSESMALSAGDVLFFHSRLLHSAGRNLTEKIKMSAVFSYHQASNRPIEGSWSDRLPSLVL